MNKIAVLFSLVLTSITVNCQEIYSKAFGNANDKPIIYLHGGPGYNSVSFEITTSQKLSENGFYVITYDRRGEGRSPDKNAKFTFNQTLDDLDLIYKKFNLKSATLIGHSFGGIIALLYAEKYPNRTTSIILTATPLAIQETFSTILESSKKIYKNKKDNINLKYINKLEKMDKSSIEYSSYCLGHAIQNGFYSPIEPTKEALKIYLKFKTDHLLLKYASKMTHGAAVGFWKNEQYTTFNLKENLKNLVINNIAVFGIYGKNDGLFSKNQIIEIENIIGVNNFKYLDTCAHNAFIDRQNIFINTLKEWLK